MPSSSQRPFCAALVPLLLALTGSLAAAQTTEPEEGPFDSLGRWFTRKADALRAPFLAPPTNGAPLGLSLLTALPESTADSCPRLIWAALEDQPVPHHAVILIHGLDEPGNIWDVLAPHLYQQGHATIRFDYPNDQAIADSSVMLIECLRELQARGTRRITLIGHSMGGLVIRDAVTSLDGYAGVVKGRYDLPEIVRFISVATPVEGSEWARFRAVLEVRERIGRIANHDEPDWLDLFRNTDGNGQAGRDLTPGSDFLTSLAQRPCPLDLPQTAIISRWVAPAASSIGQFITSPRMRSVLGDARAERWLADLESSSDSLGDGVVSLDSACAALASDTVVLAADHRSLLQRSKLLDSVPLFACDAERDHVPVAIPIILDRLERDRQSLAAPPAETR